MNATPFVRMACAAALAASPILAQSADKLLDKVIFEHQVAGPASADVMFIGSPMHVDGATVKGAPYSADAVSETVQSLANGNRIVRKNTSQIYRDSEGRTRREETMSGVGPWASSGGTKTFVSINDPTTNTAYHLDPDKKTATKLGVRVSVTTVGLSSAGIVAEKQILEKQLAEKGARVGTFAVGGAAGGAMTAHARVEYQQFDSKDAKVEDLGQKSIEGVIARGTRNTLTIPAGAIGNEQPIETVNERWYSDELKTVVMSKSSDPRFGDTTFRLSNIRRAEPPAYLFQVPSDYKVEELPAPPAGPMVIQYDKK